MSWIFVFSFTEKVSWLESEWECENDVAKEALTDRSPVQSSEHAWNSQDRPENGKLFRAWRRETKNSTPFLLLSCFPPPTPPLTGSPSLPKEYMLREIWAQPGSPVEHVSEPQSLRLRNQVMNSVHAPSCQAFPDRKPCLHSFSCREHYSSVISPLSLLILWILDGDKLEQMKGYSLAV